LKSSTLTDINYNPVVSEAYAKYLVMAAPGAFHYFHKLPNECQLMIWTFYRDDMSGTRHCFSLDGDSLLYAPLRRDDYALHDNDASGFDGLDFWTKSRPSQPVERMKLAGTVSILVRIVHPIMIFENCPASRLCVPHELSERLVRRSASPQVWANYSEDTFYFDWPEDLSPNYR
jgi:hypothetical protein